MASSGFNFENRFDSAQECLRRKNMTDVDGRRSSPSLSHTRARDDARFRHDESSNITHIAICLCDRSDCFRFSLVFLAFEKTLA